MRTHVEYDPRDGVYNVWCWERRGDRNIPMEYRPTPTGMALAYCDEDGIPAESATLRDVAPTLRIDHEIVQALIENYQPGLLPGNALSDALRDARATRDRLLTIIEQSGTRPVRGRT